jgi:hypothetical protein
MPEKYDVIIIGTGAGGWTYTGTLGQKGTPAGRGRLPKGEQRAAGRGGFELG